MLAAAIGCFAVAVLALAGDKSAAIKSSLNFYRPTGPLSGVTTVAIVIWLVAWGLLGWRWHRKTVAAGRIIVAALVLLGLGLLLTFPPMADVF
jgi:MFS family permease